MMMMMMMILIIGVVGVVFVAESSRHKLCLSQTPLGHIQHQHFLSCSRCICARG